MKNWLTNFTDLISDINKDFKGDHSEKAEDLSKEFFLLPENEQTEVLNIFRENFKNDTALYLFILSVAVQCGDSSMFSDEIVNVIIENNYHMFKSNLINQQLRRFDTKYITQMRLQKYLKTEFSRIFGMDKYKFIPVEERDQNTIIVVTEQIVSPLYAPTKQVLDYCSALMKMGKNIILLSVPTKEQMFADEWFDLIVFNINEEINDGFSITHGDIQIQGNQTAFCLENMSSLIGIVDFIAETKPLFVWSIETVNPIPDILTNITTVVAQHCHDGFPLSTAQILLKNEHMANETNSEYIKSQNQKILTFTEYSESDTEDKTKATLDKLLPEIAKAVLDK